jgi:hypothetical protein
VLKVVKVGISQQNGIELESVISCLSYGVYSREIEP